MRNVKVKAIKKIALLSFAVFMLSAGITYAANDWSSFQTEAQTGTVNIESQTIQTDGNGLNLGAPPVPSLTINGNGNTIQAGGSGAAFSRRGGRGGAELPAVAAQCGLAAAASGSAPAGKTLGAGLKTRGAARKKFFPAVKRKKSCFSFGGKAKMSTFAVY